MTLLDEFLSSEFFDAGFQNFLVSKLSVNRDTAVNKFDWVLKTLQTVDRFSGLDTDIYIKDAVKSAATAYLGTLYPESPSQQDDDSLEPWLRTVTRTQLVDGLWSLDVLFAQLGDALMNEAPCSVMYSMWTALTKVWCSFAREAANAAGPLDEEQLERDMEGAQRLWKYFTYSALKTSYGSDWEFEAFESKAASSPDLPIPDSPAMNACRTEDLIQPELQHPVQVEPTELAALERSTSYDTYMDGMSLWIQQLSKTQGSGEIDPESLPLGDYFMGQSSIKTEIEDIFDSVSEDFETDDSLVTISDVLQRNSTEITQQMEERLYSVNQATIWIRENIKNGVIKNEKHFHQLNDYIDQLTSFKNLEAPIRDVTSVVAALEHIKDSLRFAGSVEGVDLNGTKAQIKALLLDWESYQREFKLVMQLIVSKFEPEQSLESFKGLWALLIPQIDIVERLRNELQKLMVFKKHHVDSSACWSAVSVYLTMLEDMSQMDPEVLILSGIKFTLAECKVNPVIDEKYMLSKRISHVTDRWNMILRRYALRERLQNALWRRLSI